MQQTGLSNKDLLEEGISEKSYGFRYEMCGGLLEGKYQPQWPSGHLLTQCLCGLAIRLDP